MWPDADGESGCLASGVSYATAPFGWQTLQIGILTAILFGLFHLSLVFNDATAFYVARFTIAAICFGAVVPSLMLATRNGATLSYGLHWGFYVADNIFTHFMLSSSF